MKAKSRFHFIAGLVFAFGFSCAGQHASNWRVYRAADGLPETFAASVSIGQRGHVWVRHPHVEWAGRLGGYDVQAIPAPGLGTSRIYEGGSGQIWTCTSEGLQRYQGAELGWVRYNFPELNSILRTNSLLIYHQVPLFPLRQNHVLVLLPGVLLECGEETGGESRSQKIRTADQTGLQQFLGMASSRDGGLWISGTKGLEKIPSPARNLTSDVAWEEHLAPANLRVKNLHDPVPDEEGGVTMIADSLDGSGQAVVYFDGQKWFVRAKGEKMLQAWRGQENTFWICSQTALLRLGPDDSKPVQDESISARRFLDVAVETNGVFWLATSDGLLRYAPFCWRTPGEAKGVSSFIHAMAEDREDRIWVASTDGLNLLANEHWTNFAYPAEVATDLHDIPVLFPLTNGTVAMEAENRLLQFDPATARFQFVDAPRGESVSLLGLLKDGTLCVRLFHRGTNRVVSEMALFDGTRFTPLPFSQPDEPEPQLLRASQNGTVWLTGQKGLWRLRDQKWRLFTHPALPSTAISSLVEMSDTKIWCGIEDRIMEFDGNTWNVIRSGFDHVNSMVKAADGSIWVASDDGLFRFHNGVWMANNTEEGLPSDGIHAIFQDHHGKLWAATPQGLSQYHPEADPDAPRTFIQNLADKNNSVREGDIVNISFNGQDKWKYTPEDRLLYSYHLDGRDWSAYQEQRSVSFLDLAVGKHTLYVRTMDRNWNVDQRPAMLDFSVAVPWFRETRLLLISALGMGAAVFFAGLAFNRHRRLLRSYAEVEAKVALRTKQLELANQELFHSQKMNALGTLAAGIAHDFNNILSIIKGSAQIIESNLEDQEKIRVRTDRIKTVVEQGSGIVKAMLGFSRTSDDQPPVCDVNETVLETIKLLGDRFLREVEVQFTPLPSLPQVPASKDFIQQCLLNFIFNAADAMTEKRHVILSVALTERLPEKMALKPAAAKAYVTVSVKDFGTGIGPEIMHRIFEPFFTTKAFSSRRGTGLGLSMVYELARQMDGGLSVESTPGQGSTFTLILPVRDLPMDEPGKKR